MSQAKKAGRHATGKITVSIRIQRKTKSRIEDAIAGLGGDISMSEYVEKAVETRLALDRGHGKPDFGTFFAKHPLIPGGDTVL
jgi:hypothetical protein